jgi:hypothetical protein
MLTWIREWDASTLAVVLLAAAIALAGVVALSWHQFRARSRWRAALDAYAELEITRQRRRIELKRVNARSSAERMSGGAGALSDTRLARGRR